MSKRVVLIKSVHGLVDDRKEALQRKGIHRLDDLKSYTVGEVWSLVVIPYGDEFAHLVRAMKAAKAVFRDCDPRKVDLLADDIDQLELDVSIKNPLKRDGVRSIQLMHYIGGRRLKEIRLIGSGAIVELRAALKEVGVKLPD